MWRKQLRLEISARPDFSAPEQKAAPKKSAIPRWQVALSTTNGRLQLITMLRLTPWATFSLSPDRVERGGTMHMQNQNCVTHPSKVSSRQVCSTEERPLRVIDCHHFKSPLSHLVSEDVRETERHQTYVRSGTALTSWGRISYTDSCVLYSMLRFLHPILHLEVFWSSLLLIWESNLKFCP